MITPTDASGRRNWLLGLVVILLCAMSVAAGDFDINWWTVDGGGVMLSAGGEFELSGTIGQPDAGALMSGGDFTITGGFWSGAPGGSSCPADFDGDGDVDTADLLFLLGAWGTPDGDVDGDGDTDTADLLDLLAAWGPC
jgi:hypothetical protein